MSGFFLLEFHRNKIVNCLKRLNTFPLATIEHMHKTRDNKMYLLRFTMCQYISLVISTRKHFRVSAWVCAFVALHNLEMLYSLRWPFGRYKSNHKSHAQHFPLLAIKMWPEKLIVIELYPIASTFYITCNWQFYPKPSSWKTFKIAASTINNMERNKELFYNPNQSQ